MTGYSPDYPQSGIGDHKFVEHISLAPASPRRSLPNHGRRRSCSSTPSPSSALYGSHASGLAINNDGTLLTTLPYTPSLVLSVNYDTLVSYNVNESTPPSVPVPQLTLSSQGMTTDADGNYLIAAILNQTTGPMFGLDVINSGINNASPSITLASVNNLTHFGATGDVAVAPNLDLAYMAVPDDNEVVSTSFTIPSNLAPSPGSPSNPSPGSPSNPSPGSPSNPSSGSPSNPSSGSPSSPTSTPPTPARHRR